MICYDVSIWKSHKKSFLHAELEDKKSKILFREMNWQDDDTLGSIHVAVLNRKGILSAGCDGAGIRTDRKKEENHYG